MEREGEALARVARQWPRGTWVQFRANGETAWGLVVDHSLSLPYAAGARRHVTMVVDSMHQRRTVSVDAVVL